MRLATFIWAALALGVAVAGGRSLTAAEAAAPAARAERILFSSNRSGEWRIWSANVDGSQMVQLTQGTPDDNDVDPTLSPDGKRILFTSTRGGAAGVWSMASDGTDLKKVCEGDQGEWSSDGTKIALKRNGRILTRDLATGAEKTITPEGWNLCSGPTWSPDGTSIAFACRWEAGNSLFIVSTTGGEPTKVKTEEAACEPHWSPDGKMLVYETETHLCTINRDGTGNRLITYFGGVQHYARWSPDGKTLVFCQGASERGPWELYTIPSGGGAPTQITEGGSDMYPDWR